MTPFDEAGRNLAGSAALDTRETGIAVDALT
jgi:hypothetical protein